MEYLDEHEDEKNNEEVVNYLNDKDQKTEEKKKNE